MGEQLPLKTHASHIHRHTSTGLSGQPLFQQRRTDFLINGRRQRAEVWERGGLCPGLREPGYCLPGSLSPATPGSGAHMPALNSPSVSRTILITIPFGQARKTASTALVLIKKSELAILAASTGWFRPGRALTILLLEEKTPPPAPS